MKVKKVIKILKAYKEQYGNLPVTIERWGDPEIFCINVYDKNENEPTIHPPIEIHIH